MTGCDFVRLRTYSAEKHGSSAIDDRTEWRPRTLTGHTTEMRELCIYTDLTHKIFKVASGRPFSVPRMVDPLIATQRSYTSRQEKQRVRRTHRHAGSAGASVGMARGMSARRALSHGVRRWSRRRNRNSAPMVYVGPSDMGNHTRGPGLPGAQNRIRSVPFGQTTARLPTKRDEKRSGQGLQATHLRPAARPSWRRCVDRQ